MTDDIARRLLATALSADWDAGIAEFQGSYWGACPECGPSFHYRSYRGNRCVCWLNDQSDHWLYCFEHKVKWFIDSDLFSSWRDETATDWARNRTILEQCREIEREDAVCGLSGCLRGHLEGCA